MGSGCRIEGEGDHRTISKDLSGGRGGRGCVKIWEKAGVCQECVQDSEEAGEAREDMGARWHRAL